MDFVKDSKEQGVSSSKADGLPPFTAAVQEQQNAVKEIVSLAAETPVCPEMPPHRSPFTCGLSPMKAGGPVGWIQGARPTFSSWLALICGETLGKVFCLHVLVSCLKKSPQCPLGSAWRPVCQKKR